MRIGFTVAASMRERARANATLLLVVSLFAGPAAARTPARLRPHQPLEAAQADSPRQATGEDSIAFAPPLDGASLAASKRNPSAGVDVIPSLSDAALTVAEMDHFPPAFVAEAARVDAIAVWNHEHPELLKAGVTRALSPGHAIVIDASVIARAIEGVDFGGGLLSVASDTSVVWTAMVRVESAFRLRLRLADVELPKGSRIWVYGDDHTPRGPVGRELVSSERTLWCPSVTGDEVWMEVRVPIASLESGARCSFVVDQVAEIFRIDDSGAPIASQSIAASKQPRRDGCLNDVSCVPNTPEILNASRAVGLMYFVVGEDTFICSGGLINNLVNDGTPYFVTARHCISTQSAALSVEVVFDYRTTVCDGPAPSESPSSAGATLLVSRESSDFSLLQLAGVPPNRWFMGWTTASPEGATLERVSHPLGDVQAYSTTRALTKNGTCSIQGSPFLYSEKLRSGITFGSSGAPVWMGDTIVVGQLFGTCGGDAENACDRTQSIVDGRFAAAYPFVREYLEGNGGVLAGAPTSLSASATSDSGVELRWMDNAAGDVVYKIERRSPGGTYALIATTDVDATAYSDNGVSPGRSYTYRVRAMSPETAQLTAYSDEVTATVPSIGPPAPEAVFAAKIKRKKVTLAWADMSNDEETFEVLVADGSSFHSVEIVGANSTVAVIKGLRPRTTYRFGVRSCNSAACSAIVQTTVTTK